MPNSDVLVGLFTGGRSSRMGRAKGLLPHPDGTSLLERWDALLSGMGHPWVLVGDVPEYRPLGLPTLQDSPQGVGPMGGLAPLVSLAGGTHVVALAVDMPFVTRAMLEALFAARTQAPIVAARRDNRWEPFFATLEVATVAPLIQAQLWQGEHSLQRLFERAGARALSLSKAEEEALRDWDTPQDVVRDGGPSPSRAVPTAGKL